MAIVTKQVTANASTPTFLCSVPNGVCSVPITNAGTTDVLIGSVPIGTPIANVNMTQNNSAPVNSASNLAFQCYAASKGADLYVLVATGGSTQSVGILISTTD